MKTEEELRKRVVEILADYAYNSTKTETTEQYADKIIDLIIKKFEDEVKEKVKKLKEEIINWEYKDEPRVAGMIIGYDACFLIDRIFGDEE